MASKEPGRLVKPAPDELVPAQRELYEAIAGGPRSVGPQAFPLTDERGGLHGPFNAMLLSPQLGGALQALGSAVRYGSGLTDRAREIAILTVAHVWASDFEIYAHTAVGRAAGLTEADLAAVRVADHAALADPVEQLVLRTAAALATRSDLSDDDYAAAVGVLGEPLLFELTTLVGYYATLALQLRVFRVGVPD